MKKLLFILAVLVSVQAIGQRNDADNTYYKIENLAWEKIDTVPMFLLVSDRTRAIKSGLVVLTGYVVTHGDKKIYLDYKKKQLPQRFMVWQEIKNN